MLILLKCSPLRYDRHILITGGMWWNHSLTVIFTVTLCPDCIEGKCYSGILSVIRNMLH